MESKNKYTVFPIKYHNIWDLYKKHVSAFWTADEIDLSRDINDWNKLNENEQFFIKNILAFFAASDGIVNENLVLNFYEEIEITEMRSFYAFQIAIESIHSEMYSLLIDTYVKNKKEQNDLFDAVEKNDAVKLKAEWALKWTNREHASFIERLLAFIFVEGIFFSGSFCSIFWLKQRGLMPGLTLSNEFISRDERLHCDAGVELFLTLIDEKIIERPGLQLILNILQQAVDIEKKFITKSLPVKLIGMNCEKMCDYIEFVADRLLTQLGYVKVYNKQNPFSFMNLISLNSKTNFFESRNSSYIKPKVGNTQEENSFSLTEDF